MARGSVTERKNKGGRVWVLTYDLPPDPITGVRRQKREVARDPSGTPLRTKREAEALLSHRMSSPVTEGGGVPLSAYLAGWLAGYRVRHKESSYLRRESDVRLHIDPVIGHIRLDRLAAPHVALVHTRLLERGRAPLTVRGVHTTLVAALNEAVDHGLIGRNPATRVSRPAVPEPEVVVWTAQEAAAFFRWARESLYWPLYVVAMLANLRIGEACALSWGDVDWERRRLWIRRAVTRVAGGQVVGTPKTNQSRSVVVLSEHAILALQEQQERQDERRRILGRYWSENGWVFDRGDGGLTTTGTVRYHFYKDAALSGVPRITFHRFSRHLGATLSVELNIPIDVVAKGLRHRSIATTARHYRHVTGGEQERAAGMIDAAIFGDD